MPPFRLPIVPLSLPSAIKDRIPTLETLEKAVDDVANTFPELDGPVATIRETFKQINHKRAREGPQPQPPLPSAVLCSLARAIQAYKNAGLNEDAELLVDFVEINYDSDLYKRAMEEVTALPELKHAEMAADYALRKIFTL